MFKISSAEFIKGIRGNDPITHDGRLQIAFVGRSNVGKSSLINALVGSTSKNIRNRLAKVGKKPGKTQEINFFLINKQVYFVDLPGYGYAQVNPKEKEKLKKLIGWYLSEEVEENSQQKLIIIVLDVQVGITPFDREVLGVVQEYGHQCLVVANKADKLSQTELSKQLTGIRSLVNDVVVCSTVARGGTRELLDALGLYILS